MCDAEAKVAAYAASVLARYWDILKPLLENVETSR